MSNSKRRCLYCRDYFPQADMHDAPVGWFCTYEHLLAYAADKGIKALNKDRKQQAKAHKLKDGARQRALTQTVINRLCLALDAGRPCISCGRPDGGPRKRNAGHFKSRGSNSFLRFDLRNIHAQCINCNLYQSGNIEGYRQGLAQRHGSAIVDYLDTSPQSKAWTPQELVQLRKDAAAEIRRIESGEQPSRDWRKVQQESAAA